MPELYAMPRYSGLGETQPSLALCQLIATDGTYPERAGNAATNTVGMIHSLAAHYHAYGACDCAGLTLPVSPYEPLFAVLGSTYGGNGIYTFGIPDLRGRVAVGGDPEQEPAQDRLAMTYMIAVAGASGEPAPYPMAGAIGLFAGNYAPAGWLPADGRMLAIGDDVALFQLIGNPFGGNGQSDFALPNLGGRGIVGAGQGRGLAPVDVGEILDDSGSGSVPGLGMNYLICIGGTLPPNLPPLHDDGGFPNNVAAIGEVIAYAGSNVPDGWALAHGQLLAVAGNAQLFAMIGTTFGGDGQTSFALPDLRGRMMTGLMV